MLSSLRVMLHRSGEKEVEGEEGCMGQTVGGEGGWGQGEELK